MIDYLPLQRHARPVGGESFAFRHADGVVGDGVQAVLRETGSRCCERKKSFDDRPLAKRAVAPVGSTCDGPAT